MFRRIFLLGLIATLCGTSVLTPSAESAPPRRSTLPRSHDWTRRGVGTVVRNQGNTQACWIFAAVGALEANWTIRNGSRPVMAVQPILDRTRQTGPARISLAFNELKNRGTTSGRSYPWLGRPASIRRTSMPYRVSSWGFVTSVNVRPSIAAMKRAILARGPITAGLKTTQGFKSHKGRTVYRERQRMKTPTDMNHYVLIVGWDDARRAWKVRNSWGTNWGDRGFAWIGYGSNNIGIQSAWVSCKPATRNTTRVRRSASRGLEINHLAFAPPRSIARAADCRDD